MSELYNIACLVEYDGSNFYGFQTQPDVPTIQHELELALSKFTNQPINVITAGRTDTGVHASGQVINFTTSAKRDINGFPRALNALLPKSISIKKTAYVAPDFHARFNALSRTYHYYLLNLPTRPAILHTKVGWYPHKLNLDLMQQACATLVGTHDFSSFRASDCQAKNPYRNMLISAVKELDYVKNIFEFKFTANAFLYHMVRNIIGSLIYVGSGKLSLDEFGNLLQQKNRVYAPPTFMPDGLYLTDVDYGYEVFAPDNLRFALT
jgi:tRNA pseudouridine38-40 synthase